MEAPWESPLIAEGDFQRMEWLFWHDLVPI